MELKIKENKEPELKFKKELEVSIHKKRFILSPRAIKAAKVTFHTKPDADILGKRNKSATVKSEKRMYDKNRSIYQRQTYRRQSYRKNTGGKAKTQVLGKSAQVLQQENRDTSPEQVLKSAGAFLNIDAKERYRRKTAVESVAEPKKSKMINAKLAAKGVRRGGGAALTEVDGGEEIKQSLHVMSTAARPAEIFAEKQKYRRAEEKLKIKPADGKISSRQYTKMQKRTMKKSAQTQRNKAIKQRKMQYVINKLTGSGEQDNIVQTLKDIVKMKTSFVMLKAVKFMAVLLAPLFTLLLTVAIPVVIIALLFYCSPIAAFMPSPSDNPTVREVLSGYYAEFNTKLSEQGTDNIEYLHNDEGNYVSNFMDTLMVYMVQYGTGDMGVDMDDKHKKYLKEIFEEMNSFENTTITTTIKAGQSLGNVVTSGYCQCTICCGQWAGGPTASGVMPTAEHTLAVDASNPFVPMGTRIIMNGIEYTVEDTGAFDQFGVQFDVFCNDHATASAWGHQTFEAFLADGDENEITVTKQGNFVKNLNYEDYIALGKLTAQQEELLREVMSEEFRSEIPSFGVGSDVANLALTKVGCKYSQDRRYEEGYYDCSSLVQRLYRECGIELPSIASTQGQYIVNNGLEVTEDMLEPGDLIFYSYENNGQFRNISHVAIYIGNGRQVHAANTARGVVNDPLIPSNIGLYGRPSMGK